MHERRVPIGFRSPARFAPVLIDFALLGGCSGTLSLGKIGPGAERQRIL